VKTYLEGQFKHKKKNAFIDYFLLSFVLTTKCKALGIIFLYNKIVKTINLLFVSLGE